jgi:hypothetical protein
MPHTFRLAALIKPWICYCLATSTVFQAFFTSYLANPGLEIKSQLLRISQTHKWSSDIETASLSQRFDSLGLKGIGETQKEVHPSTLVHTIHYWH